MELKIIFDDELDIEITQDTDETTKISLESDENQINFIITNENLISLSKEIRAYIQKQEITENEE